MDNQKVKLLLLSLNKKFILFFLFILGYAMCLYSQCLSSVNPVGGTENLLVLEKKSFRLISFYKYGQGTQYFEGHKHSDFNLIKEANYNYLSLILGYGLSKNLTLEADAGYYINKSQLYNSIDYTLTGKGFSNLILSAKFNIYTNPVKRIYYSLAAGPKIPFSTAPQWANNVKLPLEVQPTLGAYGLVVNSVFVKEYSLTGLRFFVTNRWEGNLPNKEDYLLGMALNNALYVSKHLLFPWLKGDWTAIIQLRNEIRSRDKIDGDIKESSGSILFFIVPQLNYVLYEKWNLSALADIPVYQYFYGTQLGAGFGLIISISRTFDLYTGKKEE